MNKNKVIGLLRDFVSIQSVSTDPKRFGQILEAANFLKKKLDELGFKVNVISRPKAPPLIIASKEFLNAKKTIGIYGHYDVQPEDPVGEWKTDPFKLTLKNNRFFGRGTADNKGHIVQNLAAIESLIKSGKLNSNIVCIFEGEEEVDSRNFEEYIKEANKILKNIDVFFVTDMGMANKNIPQIFYGLRGLLYFILTIKIGEHDIHSGVYGNRVLNPIQLIANLLTKIKSYNSNRINIPYFYDRCRKPTEAEKNELKKTVPSLDRLKNNAGVYEIVEYDGIHPSFASKIYPSFETHGIMSGYTGPGGKTIIPSMAEAKFSFRLVEHQNPDEIEQLVKNFVKKNLPKGVKYALKTYGKSAPFYTDMNNPYVKKTKMILETVFKNQCILNRSGGSVAAAEILQRVYKKPIVLVGFTLPDDNLHAPNENYDEEMFWKGTEAFEKIYGRI